jgi:hypothetical protein
LSGESSGSVSRASTGSTSDLLGTLRFHPSPSVSPWLAQRSPRLKIMPTGGEANTKLSSGKRFGTRTLKELVPPLSGEPVPGATRTTNPNAGVSDSARRSGSPLQPPVLSRGRVRRRRRSGTTSRVRTALRLKEAGRAGVQTESAGSLLPSLPDIDDMCCENGAFMGVFIDPAAKGKKLQRTRERKERSRERRERNRKRAHDRRAGGAHETDSNMSESSEDLDHIAKGRPGSGRQSDNLRIDGGFPGC